MTSFDELHNQNHKITELSNILTTLLKDRSLCDSPVTCDLFYRYVDLVNEHMNETEAGMYAELLRNGGDDNTNVARKFMSGSQEIRRIFSNYIKKWCRPKSKRLMVKEHQEFLNETEAMFQLVLDRIVDETEHLYPAVKQAAG